MSPARRTAKRRDWPRGLYEPRPGFYVWRHPHTGETFSLGRVSLAHARNEALAANAHIAAEAPTLVARISGETNTIAQLVADMPLADKRTTRNTFRALDKIITEGALQGEERVGGLGQILAGGLSVKHCAELLDLMVKAGKDHQAQAVRTRLIAVCARGMRKGWMSTNPAEVTEKPKTTVARGRLSLEAFLAIREVAEPWLARAMTLALVTGQDRSTVAGMRRADVKDERLICQRSKTADKAPPIAIPLSLHLQAIDTSLEAILRARTGIVSPYLVHHTERQGRAAPGDRVGVNLITNAFTDARKRAGIPDTTPDGKGAPTFHEIRSLSKRLYDAQGAAGGMKVDTKTLLGHMTEAMAKLYANARDGAPVEVRVINAK